MFWVETPFRSQMFSHEVDALRHAVDSALQMPTCRIVIRKDEILHVAVQRGEEEAGTPLERDLLAFLRSRTA